MNIKDEVIGNIIKRCVDDNLCPEEIGLEQESCVANCKDCWVNAFNKETINQSPIEQEGK